MTRLRLPTRERPTTDDQALLARIATSDNLALATLYDRYARTIYSMTCRMLDSPELAEDVVQETFWRIWRRSSTFDAARGQVASWIMGIAHNLAIDELRRQRVRPVVIYDSDDRPVLREIEDPQANVLGTALAEERRRMIADALERIPPEQREVIELAYFGGLSQNEIAERLKNPIGTVKTRVRLGLQKLREIVQAAGFRLEDIGD